MKAELATIEKIEKSLADYFAEVQQPQSPFQLERFVVGQHDGDPRRWQQCTIELQNRLFALRRAQLARKRLLIEIDRLESTDDPLARIDADVRRVDLAEHELAVLGVTREVHTLWAVWNAFPKTFTRAEIDAAESDYWNRRLTRQANQDLAACGSIGIGNQEALRQAGIEGDICRGLPERAQLDQDRLKLRGGDGEIHPRRLP